MNDEAKFPSLAAAVSSGVATIAAGAASVAFDDYAKILGGATGLMAGGFLFFVRKWMNDREEADRKLADTIRAHSEQQRRFNEKVVRFMSAVTGHLGLHDVDSDPAMLISQARRRSTDRKDSQ